MNKIILNLFLLLLCSCATLYSGQDLKSIERKELSTSLHSISFRFFGLTHNSYGGNYGYYIRRSEHMSDAYVGYIDSLKVFSKVEAVRFPYESVDVKNSDDFDKLLKDTMPEIQTDYFVDVKVVMPFNPHGGGLGMWGGLISAATLGIIPSWWQNEYKYEVSIYKKGIKIGEESLKESYNTFHSTLFHLVPSSEYTFRKDLNKIDKNSIRTIIQHVVQQIEHSK
ncbi:hypothetical protein ACJVC5_14990 [Peredibacter sp. HCB2-198]|uniref:hypothetical protein n=1 Tax=Peredibacter sp. HCB2-198 TaxID=3383025 RepID=UPI0038B57C55